MKRLTIILVTTDTVHKACYYYLFIFEAKLESKGADEIKYPTHLEPECVGEESQCWEDPEGAGGTPPGGKTFLSFTKQLPDAAPFPVVQDSPPNSDGDIKGVVLGWYIGLRVGEGVRGGQKDGMSSVKDGMLSVLIWDGGGPGGDLVAGRLGFASSNDWMRPFSLDLPGLFFIATETLLLVGSSKDSDFLSEGRVPQFP